MKPALVLCNLIEKLLRVYFRTLLALALARVGREKQERKLHRVGARRISKMSPLLIRINTAVGRPVQTFEINLFVAKFNFRTFMIKGAFRTPNRKELAVSEI